MYEPNEILKVWHTNLPTISNSLNLGHFTLLFPVTPITMLEETTINMICSVTNSNCLAQY